MGCGVSTAIAAQQSEEKVFDELPSRSLAHSSLANAIIKQETTTKQEASATVSCKAETPPMNTVTPLKKESSLEVPSPVKAPTTSSIMGPQPQAGSRKHNSSLLSLTSEDTARGTSLSSLGQRISLMSRRNSRSMNTRDSATPLSHSTSKSTTSLRKSISATSSLARSRSGSQGRGGSKEPSVTEMKTCLHRITLLKWLDGEPYAPDVLVEYGHRNDEDKKNLVFLQNSISRLCGNDDAAGAPRCERQLSTLDLAKNTNQQSKAEWQSLSKRWKCQDKPMLL